MTLNTTLTFEGYELEVNACYQEEEPTEHDSPGFASELEITDIYIESIEVNEILDKDFINRLETHLIEGINGK